MIIYIGLLLWVLFFSYVAQKAIQNKKGKKDYFAFFMILVGMVYVYAMRWNVGTDFSTYKENFEWIGRLPFSEMLKVGNEQLFNTIVWSAYQIMPGKFVFHNLLMGILIYGLAINTMRKLTKEVLIAILFYMFICYTYAFNGTRQTLAAMLCFAAYPLLEKKKYILYFIVLFMASKIHITVLLIFPFFFLGKLPFDNKKLVLCEILIILFSLSITKYWDKVMEFLTFIEMDKLVEDYQDITRAYGTKFIRVFVKIPIVAVALWRYPTLKKNDTDGRLNYILNMSIFSVIFTVAGLRIVNLARFSDYFSIYQCLLITRLFKSMNIRQEQVILNTCMIICYILMWIVLLHVDSELLPYKLENGKVFS